MLFSPRSFHCCDHGKKGVRQTQIDCFNNHLSNHLHTHFQWKKPRCNLLSLFLQSLIDFDGRNCTKILKYREIREALTFGTRVGFPGKSNFIPHLHLGHRDQSQFIDSTGPTRSTCDQAVNAEGQTKGLHSLDFWSTSRRGQDPLDNKGA